MSPTVSLREAQAAFSHLVNTAREGDDVIITRSGIPVAKIVAYVPGALATPLGALKGVLPDISVDEWEESDRAIAHLWEF
jgi:prevent-host-death family protein